jgi:hypothetical protein
VSGPPVGQAVAGIPKGGQGGKVQGKCLKRESNFERNQVLKVLVNEFQF